MSLLEKRKPHPATLAKARGAHPATAARESAPHPATAQLKLHRSSERSQPTPRTAQRAELSRKPVDLSRQIVDGYNAAVTEFYTTRMKRALINNLDDLQEITSNPELDCNSLGSALFESLETACRATHVKQQRSFTKQQLRDAVDDGTLASLLPEGSFANFSLQGGPSDLNHVFSVYSREKTMMLQSYVRQQVRICRSVTTKGFLVKLKELATDNASWAEAYEKLFEVDPASVCTAPKQSWLEQLVLTTLVPR
jgi:hypothetical protein